MIEGIESMAMLRVAVRSLSAFGQRVELCRFSSIFGDEISNYNPSRSLCGADVFSFFVPPV
jgi:hypothetical protein